MFKTQDLINDLTLVVAEYLALTVKGITPAIRDQMVKACANDDFADFKKEIARHVTDQDRNRQLLYIIATIQKINGFLQTQQFTDIKNAVTLFLTNIEALKQSKSVKVELPELGEITLFSLQRATLSLITANLSWLLDTHVVAKYKKEDLDVLDLQQQMEAQKQTVTQLTQDAQSLLAINLELRAELDEAQKTLAKRESTNAQLKKEFYKKTEESSQSTSALAKTSDDLVLLTSERNIALSQVATATSEIERLKNEAQAAFLEARELRTANERLQRELKSKDETLQLFSRHFVAAEQAHLFALPEVEEHRKVKRTTTDIVTELEKMRTQQKFSTFFVNPVNPDLKNSVNQLTERLLRAFQSNPSKRLLRSMYGIDSRCAITLFGAAESTEILFLDYLARLFKAENKGVVPDWIKSQAELTRYISFDAQNPAIEAQARLFKKIKSLPGVLHSPAPAQSSEISCSST